MKGTLYIQHPIRIIGEEMEQIEFINKIWISNRGRLVDKLLNICCWIYLILDLLLIVMEGTEIVNTITCILAIMIILHTRKNIKNSGYYMQAECRIIFSTENIIWEYPKVTLPIYKGKYKIRYEIDINKIKSIIFSKKLQSCRVECSPLIKYIGEKRNKIIDFRKNNKSCILIVYNFDMQHLEYLFRKYTGMQIDVID